MRYIAAEDVAKAELTHDAAGAAVGIGAVTAGDGGHIIALPALRLPLVGVQSQYRLRQQTQHHQNRQQSCRNALGDLLRFLQFIKAFIRILYVDKPGFTPFVHLD